MFKKTLIALTLPVSFASRNQLGKLRSPTQPENLGRPDCYSSKDDRRKRKRYDGSRS